MEEVITKRDYFGYREEVKRWAWLERDGEGGLGQLEGNSSQGRCVLRVMRMRLGGQCGHAAHGRTMGIEREPIAKGKLWSVRESDS